jgi:hypothetical protein
MRKPTIKQKIAFTKLIEKIENKEPIKMGEIMLQSGFSKVTAINPGKNLLEKVGWQQLLSKIDDSVILERINNILIDEDKRASLQAADMLLKLKDRYPANKIKMTAFDERDKVLEEINLNVEDGTYKETFNESNI